MTLRATVCTATLAWAFAAQAQFGGLLDQVKERAKHGATDEVGRQAEDAARGAVRVDKNKPAPPQKQDGGVAKAESAAPGEAQAAAAPPPGEVYGNRYDFVRGDKVLACDDFSDTDVGEYPAKWTIKGGGGNAVEVVEVGGKRFLKARFQKDGQEDSLHWLRYTVRGDLPKKFTVEFDADVEGPFELVFSNARNAGGQSVVFHRNGREVSTTNARGKDPQAKGLHHVAVAVSGTQVKAYVDGDRVLSDPEAVERPIKRIGLIFGSAIGPGGDHELVTSFQLAEGGGKDPKAMLAGEGRVVTHGILFDSGSDVIKPESGPALRTVLALLTDDPALRFRIEGHTDDQGGPKVNGPLSEHRAAAVRTWLVKQGVEEERLVSKGLGATKPIDANDSAEGRANNRRVEFVKLTGTAS